MNGSWHRYRPGERWRRPPARARLVLEVPGAVAVCFDAPVVELFETRAEAIHPSLSRLGPDLLSPAFDAGEALRRLRAPERASVEIGVALARPARDGRASAMSTRTRCSGWSGSRRSRRVADLDDETLGRLWRPRADCLNASARRGRQRARLGGPGPSWDERARTSTAAPAGPAAAAGRRSPAPRQGTELPRTHVLVPDLPGSRALASADMCEHFIARAAEPFRLDALWPFTERLERFGIAGFGWGAAWLGRDGRPGVLPRPPCVPGRPGSRARRRDRDDRRARPPPSAIEAVDADAAGHPAVRRSRRPLRLQPQRRPARLPDASRARYRADGRIHGRADTEVAARWLEDAWPGGRPCRVCSDRAARAVRRAGQPRGARGRTGRRTTTPATRENPLFAFRLGRIGIASTGIYSLDRSLFRLVAPGATDRRLVRTGSIIELDPARWRQATVGAGSPVTLRPVGRP